MTLIGSLAAYLYAKQYMKDAVPYVMVGGFIGAVVGDTIAEAIKKDSNNN